MKIPTITTIKIPTITTIKIHTPATAQPFIGVHVDSAGESVLIPLDLEAAEATVQRLAALLSELRAAQATAVKEAQASAEEALGISVGDVVRVIDGAVAGRDGTVVAVTKEKVTVHKVAGLLPNERLQLRPDQVRRR